MLDVMVPKILTMSAIKLESDVVSMQRLHLFQSNF